MSDLSKENEECPICLGTGEGNNKGYLCWKCQGFGIAPTKGSETSSESPSHEADGCPTEKAVLQRFWREHQSKATAKE